LVSPLRGDYTANAKYAAECMRDSLQRGEAPMVPHLLYPLVLDDTVAEDRLRGMNAGAAWIAASEAVVAYVDLGLSSGMKSEIELAGAFGVPVETRRIR
jgi:hypothetical protein